MEAKEIAQYADRCMFCVSEDFGAPIGSLVCGSKEFIYELRQTRRLLGGDLRQGGVAAAPAIYALRHSILLLNEDNRRAEKLAEAIQGLDETRVRRVFHLGISEEDYGKDNSDLQDR